MAQPTQLAFTADGKQIVAASQLDCLARVWNVAERRLIRTLGAGPRGGALSLSPDGKRLAVGNNSPVVEMWDIATGRELFAEDQEPTSYVGTLAFSPDGKTLVSGGSVETLIWDPTTGKRRGPLPARAHILSFSPDGKKVAYVGEGPAFDSDGGKVIRGLTFLDEQFLPVTPMGGQFA